ncbi:UNVERIFIED_CONTAM: hypothetical protein GTU68_010104, partial [Idotea baltica]|nr:hypothetical protein [Idotea baltica]
MRVVRDIYKTTEFHKGSVATIGNFDGLHRGHLKILQQLIEKARELDLPTVVISFEPLPNEYFSKDISRRIYPFRDKAYYLKQLGIDYFVCLRFDQKLANMTAEDFVQKLLFQSANVKHLIVGDDFCFGQKREGNYELLKRMGQDGGMSVNRSPTQADQIGRISSTRIREQLSQGHLKQA